MLRLSKIAAPVAIAAVLSSLALPALADGYYHHHHRSNGGDIAAAGVIGLIGGTMLGAALASPPPPPVYYEPAPPPVIYQPAPVVVYQQPAPVYAAVPMSGEHQAWCAGRYRSYNAYDNTWVDNRGNLRPCQSPYYGG
ncbi:BA14K family protein [Pleomorphomonas koreensis]|uniref:BA14K family protein n=1 Tax=Pleomorphomonas koreensis TaxID=257440 RepID=UPI00069F887B|nr:BA14K family protein [Pleomorphomonas koreensis]